MIKKEKCHKVIGVRKVPKKSVTYYFDGHFSQGSCGPRVKIRLRNTVRSKPWILRLQITWTTLKDSKPHHNQMSTLVKLLIYKLNWILLNRSSSDGVYLSRMRKKLDFFSFLNVNVNEKIDVFQALFMSAVKMQFLSNINVYPFFHFCASKCTVNE